MCGQCFELAEKPLKSVPEEVGSGAGAGAGAGVGVGAGAGVGVDAVAGVDVEGAFGASDDRSAFAGITVSSAVA